MIQALHPFEDAVLEPLRILSASALMEEQTASRDATSASGQARLVAFLGAPLALVALYPELRVIYMSGHTQDVGLHQDAETGQVDFLQKPFSATTLVDTAREVLDRPGLLTRGAA